ncbi:MAG: ornithine cyclodeaminase family protein [Opitutaceae bacterium]|nr:ornithine cyclodeaminase family protein [Opitutaceae bacterium]
MARETILLSRQEIGRQIDVVDTIDAIERAMGVYEKGEDYLPPKAIFEIPVGEPAMAACITGMTKAANLLSMKVGHERTNNPQRQLPTTNSWISCFDPLTGELLMICDGTLPTMYRTAAAAAVGARQLARPDSRTLAVIGAGQLGRECLRAVAAVRLFAKIYVHDRFENAARALAQELHGRVKAPIEVASAEAACRAADVIVTATNSREPIVMSDWIRPGTHLSCMGADLHEKIECEMKLLPRCRLFADKIEHALLRGEVSQAVQHGLLGKDCYAGSLGQVINGAPGRRAADEITMFDGVGIGIQDTTIVRTIYDQAVKKNLGQRMAFS